MQNVFPGASYRLYTHCYYSPRKESFLLGEVKDTYGCSVRFVIRGIAVLRMASKRLSKYAM